MDMIDISLGYVKQAGKANLLMNLVKSVAKPVLGTTAKKVVAPIGRAAMRSPGMLGQGLGATGRFVAKHPKLMGAAVPAATSSGYLASKKNEPIIPGEWVPPTNKTRYLATAPDTALRSIIDTSSKRNLPEFAMYKNRKDYSDWMNQMYDRVNKGEISSKQLAGMLKSIYGMGTVPWQTGGADPGERGPALSILSKWERQPNGKLVKIRNQRIIPGAYDKQLENLRRGVIQSLSEDVFRHGKLPGIHAIYDERIGGQFDSFTESKGYTSDMPRLGKISINPLIARSNQPLTDSELGVLAHELTHGFGSVGSNQFRSEFPAAMSDKIVDQELNRRLASATLSPAMVGQYMGGIGPGAGLGGMVGPSAFMHAGPIAGMTKPKHKNINVQNMLNAAYASALRRGYFTPRSAQETLNIYPTLRDINPEIMRAVQQYPR